MGPKAPDAERPGKSRLNQLPTCSDVRAGIARLLGTTLLVGTSITLGIAQAPNADRVHVPILVYHRFGAVVADSMTVRTSTFRWQLQYLKQHDYQPIPLRSLIAHFRDGVPTLPPRPVVVTVDDGHRSVFTELLPLVREYAIPVTLFIYPSAISNASYAMTWGELEALVATKLFSIQSHTFWHPRFDLEKQRLAPSAYREFVTTQLQRSRRVIEERLGTGADVIAWPFGMTDNELIQMAADCGYIGGVTLGGRAATATDSVMALPRFLITEATSRASFVAMLSSDPP